MKSTINPVNLKIIFAACQPVRSSQLQRLLRSLQPRRLSTWSQRKQVEKSSSRCHNISFSVFMGVLGHAFFDIPMRLDRVLSKPFLLESSLSSLLLLGVVLIKKRNCKLLYEKLIDASHNIKLSCSVWCNWNLTILKTWFKSLHQVSFFRFDVTGTHPHPPSSGIW